MRWMLGALLLIALATAGCGDDAGGGDGGGDGGGGGSGTGSGESEVVLTVYVDDAVVAEWTLAELEATLTFVSLEMDGDVQRGPRLLDVMAASGISHDQWRTGEVLGKGEGRAFDVAADISVTTVDDAWIFDVTNRGTLKLAAPDLPREQWVRDAGEIRIP